MAELPEESSLCAPVAVAKRMDCIYFSEVVRQPFDELITRTSPQIPLFCKPAEHIRRIRLDMLRQAKRIQLRDSHHPDLACSGEQVTENLPMERPKMIEIVTSRQNPSSQVRQRSKTQIRFDPAQQISIENLKTVAQHTRLGIYVWIYRHRRPCKRRTRSRIWIVLISSWAHC